MTNRVFSLVLLHAILSTVAGCRLLCGTPDGFCPPGFCDPQNCTDQCGQCGLMLDEDCGYARPPALPRRPAAVGWRMPVYDDPCDGCEVACRPCGYHGGPLRWLYRLLTRNCYWGRSCGELYWGDWWNDPPDCCDPCDRCGNFTGVHVRGCVDGDGGIAYHHETQPYSSSRCQQCQQPTAVAATAKGRTPPSSPQTAAPSANSPMPASSQVQDTVRHRSRAVTSGNNPTPAMARPPDASGAGASRALRVEPRQAAARPASTAVAKPRRSEPDGHNLSLGPHYFSPDAAARGDYSPRLISVEERVLTDEEVAARQAAARNRPADTTRR